MYKFELEKGSKKYVCPACSAKKYVRYVRTGTNEYLDSDVGRCDRESSCGYHFTPKMYFEENPQCEIGQIGHFKKKRRSQQGTIQINDTRTKETAQKKIKMFDFIPLDYLIKSLDNYDQNSFVQFLINLFPNCIDEIQNTIKDYRIGTTKDGKTIFWQIDKNNRVRTGKIIAYDAQTGKRRKDIFPNWTHAELKKRNLIEQNFNLKQCFLGEHLLRQNPNKAVCIVEAEKSAVIASLFFPEYVWLAIGSKQSLKFEKIKKLGRDKKIILYPDADGFDEWNKIVVESRTKGFDIIISNLIERLGTDTERESGYDLADYLINEQIEKLRIKKSFIETYNYKLEKVLNDEKLLYEFETILDEQKAILIINGKVTENDAESQVIRAENLRSIILSL